MTKKEYSTAENIPAFSIFPQRDKQPKPDALEFVSFINIMSEWHAKDISKKVKTGIKTKDMIKYILLSPLTPDNVL